MKPDTILGWQRRLVGKKFDGSNNRQYPGRPRFDADIELMVRLAQENKSWGYDRIAGALAVWRPLRRSGSVGIEWIEGSNFANGSRQSRHHEVAATLATGPRCELPSIR